MKTYAALALVLAMSPGLAMAAPDFSGSWVRDNAKSTPAGYPTYWLTRSTPGGFGGNQEAVTVIKQDAASLQVTDPVHPQRTYALDGRGHQGRTDTGLGQATVTATVQGDALTIATTQPYGGMPGNVTSNVTETWRLSPDGKVLTVTTERASPAKQQTFQEVFNRR